MVSSVLSQFGHILATNFALMFGLARLVVHLVNYQQLINVSDDKPLPAEEENLLYQETIR